VIPERVGCLAAPGQEGVEVGGRRGRAETPAGGGHVGELLQPGPQRQDPAGQHDLYYRDQHQRLHRLLGRVDERGHGQPHGHGGNGEDDHGEQDFGQRRRKVRAVARQRHAGDADENQQGSLKAGDEPEHCDLGQQVGAG